MRALTSLGLMLVVVGALRGAPAATVEARSVRLILNATTAPGAPPNGTVVLREIMGPHAPVSLAISALSIPIVFSAPPHTMWQTTVDAPGWWAAPVVVTVQDADTEATLNLLPTGVVAGSFNPPKADPMPKALTVKVDVPPGATKLPGPPSAETPCNITEEGRFSCEVPAGVLDLSLHAAGYAAIYRWGVTITRAGTTDVGALPLSNGAAVTGFVSVARGKLENGKGKVALFRPTMGTNATAFRLSRPVVQTSVAANGFFQLTDVPPGRYVLLATYPGYAAATVDPIQAYGRVESKVRRPILLQLPISITFRIDPVTDFSGQPWHLEVMRASATGKFEGASIYSGIAENGVVTLREQQGGRYEVAIADAAGNPFTDEEFNIGGAGDEVRSFRIEAVKIRGTIRRGDQPLVATIWFGGRFGDRHAALKSNADGEFSGSLPHAGDWRVLVETDAYETELRTQVIKKEGKDAADIELKIPANRVSGVILDADSHPVKQATVWLGNGRESMRDRSDDAGVFHFDGVPSGEMTLVAEKETSAAIASSDVYTTKVGDTDVVDGITLRLRDGKTIHGRVIGREGAVVGAEVTVRPGTGFEHAPSSNATTGTDGVFDVHVAAGFGRALVVVAAPGYPLRVFDIALDGRAITLSMPEAAGAVDITTPADANGLYFFQDDRFLSIVDIFHWLRAHGEPIPNSSTFRVVDLAPGRYRACTLKNGSANVADMTRCADGFLPPYGELHLTIH